MPRVRNTDRVRLVPVNNGDGRYYVVVYGPDGVECWSTRPYDDGEEALRVAATWCNLNGWRSSNVIIIKGDRQHVKEAYRKRCQPRAGGAERVKDN